MESSPVVLDACVLVPAALRDTLLTLFKADLYEARWSESILEEVGRALTRMVGTSRAQNLVATIREVFPEAEVSDYQPLIDVMPTRDPGDRHVLAIAVACRARFIVTSNIRDFPEVALRPLNVPVLSPDTFLCGLFESHPKQVIHLIGVQAERLTRPPLTIDDVLDNLALHAPTFAARVRSAYELSQD